MREQPYHKLLVWQKTNDFVLRIYQTTKQFPREELFGMTSQLRRASVSVLLNIVEGHARSSKEDYRRFLFMARGSIMECACLIELAEKLEYITESTAQELETKRGEAGFLLQRVISSLK